MSSKTVWISSVVLASFLFFLQQIQQGRIQIPGWPGCPANLTEALSSDSPGRISGCPKQDLQLKQLTIQKLFGLKMDWSNSTFKGVEFRDSTLSEIDFSESKLEGTRWISSRLEQVNFKNANLKNVTILQSSLRDCRFEGADLSQARIFLSNLHGSSFNLETKLPFSHEEALRRGMIFEP